MDNVDRDERLEAQARVEAERFLNEEREFHLGALPTEQSHPKTRTLAETTAARTENGVAMLLSVGHDLPPRAGEVFRTPEFEKLVAAVGETARSGARIAFSGCGATGRLAIILEKMWRVFWSDAAARDPSGSTRWRRVSEAGYSIMTGGDRALIRSVENFEDFQSFGRRQVQDAGLGSGDLLIAISEGGETSSVIGTAWEALERGARVFFVYNNPTEVLARTVARSREIIAEERIVKLDLSTGPMALSGSTRLEATTMEMLVVGAALEMACSKLFTSTSAAEGEPDSQSFLATPLSAPGYAEAFEALVDDLESDDARASIATLVDLETELYRAGGLVTYLADRWLLDIISDTTERTPTFMLPPFRPASDTTSAVSWAFTKDPHRSTEAAWHHMLGRDPRGLSWGSADYREMGGLPRMIESPPKLDLEEILSYRIGNERDPSRFRAPDSTLILVEAGGAPSAETRQFMEKSGLDYRRAVEAIIGIWDPGRQTARPDQRVGGGGFEGAKIGRIVVPVRLARTPMELFAHLAVKLVLNTLSTATMAKLGRIRGNWMIQVDATNKKLIDRAMRIIADLAGITYEEAGYELHLTLARRATAGERFEDSTVVETLRRLGAL